MELYLQVCRIAKILLLALFATLCTAATQNDAGFDDWISNNSCSKNANKLCGGYYRQPFYPNINLAAGSNLPVTITSDEATYIAKRTSVFIGNVMATQGDKIIYADRADVVHNAETGELETITALGHVKIMEPGLRVDGTKSVSYVGTDRKVIDNAVYRIYDQHARGTAASLVVDGKNKMQLVPASYTTCAPNSNAWHLQANETNFNKETGRGEAWHAKMYLKDVPIFYLPYVNFPIDKRRQTGFLQPSLASSSLNGKTFILPFYWNIAPNYDATIQSNYMSLRGFKFDTLSRWLTPTSSSSLKFDFLPHDRAYKALRNAQYANKDFMQATDTPTMLARNDLKPRDFRYRYTALNSTNLTSNLLFNLDYTDASDGDYLYNFGSDTWNYADNQASTMYALQRTSLQYSDYIGSIKYQLEQYRTFYPVNAPGGEQQLSKLPEIAVNSATFNLPYGFNWLANANYTSFKPRIIPDNSVLKDYGQRFQVRPALQYALTEPGWFVQPRAQLNYLEYTDLHISPASRKNGVGTARAKRTTPMLDVKTGLIFERPTSFRHTELVQTLEPIVYYLYVPRREQKDLPIFDSALINFDYNQIFRDNRWSGLDRISAANQVALGLQSKFFKDDTGEEQAMLGIGQIRYLRPNYVPLNETGFTDKHWSPVAMIAKLHLTTATSLEANIVRDGNSMLTTSLVMQYRPASTKVINIGYQYIRGNDPDITGKYQNNTKQINVSGAWQVATAVRVLSLVNYDMVIHRARDLLAGMEYHTCCTALRVFWRKQWLSATNTSRFYDRSVGVQFVFKGFTGVGNFEDQEIAAAIPGYDANIKGF